MHEQEKCLLESKLSLAVEQIQKQFSKSADSIKDSYEVAHLCQCVEDILQHGLKESILHWASHSEVTFWPLVLRITCKEAVEEIRSLGFQSDATKCKLWIRQAIKENTVGSYFNVISEDKKLLKEFYQPHAFLNNPAGVDTVKNLLIYGISSFDFDISVFPTMEKDKFAGQQISIYPGSTGTTLAAREVIENGHGSPLASYTENDTFYAPLGVSSKHDAKKRKKKKKKKKTSVALIVDDDEDELSEDKEEKPDKENEEKHNGITDAQVKEKINGGIHHEVSYRQTTKGKGVEVEEVDKSTNQNIGDNEDLNIPSDEVNSALSEVHETSLEANRKIQNNTPEPLAFRKEASYGERAEEKGVEIEEVSKSTNRNIADNENHNIPSDEVNSALSEIQETSLEDNRKIQNNTPEPPAFPVITNNKLRFNTIEEYLGLDVGSNAKPGTVGAPYTTMKPHGGNQVVGATIVEHNKSVGESSVQDLSDLASNHVTEKRHSTPREATFSVCGNEIGDEEDNILSREGQGVFSAGFEEEDFNFVPGIHKQEDEILSRTSSFSSFTGSGSFRNGRGDTFDSFKSRTSTGNSEGMKDESGDTGANSDAHQTKRLSRDDSLSDFVFLDDLLGIDEDHFSPPESFMGVSTTEELRHAIQGCKDLIKGAPAHSLEKKKLVEKLVTLRLKLQEAQDIPVEENRKLKKVLGHQFLKAEASNANQYCDKCGKIIWTMWQSDFVCKDCSFHSHRKCLDLIRRPCASRKLSEASYILNICPESGLSSQQYKCAECRKRISFSKSDESEARLCDNTGQYYCEDCHWNDTLVIPARVIHNWDFAPRKVARQTKQLLDLMQNRPMLNVEQLNPTLLKYIGELREVKRLREEVLIMKKYFVSCQEARESKLLLKLQGRQHFVDSSNQYSLQDLIDVNNGTLLPFLTRVHSLFLTHIKTECQTCRGKGFLCEICKMDEVIFAFDPHALQCTGCRSVYHKTCFKDAICPKCERRKQRLDKQPGTSRS